MNITFSDNFSKLKVKEAGDIETLVRICLVQMRVSLEVEANIQKIEYSCKIAHDNKCRLIIFPEDAFWGVLHNGNVIEKAKKVGFYIKTLSRIAGKYKLFIFAPSAPLIEKVSIYNTSFCFNRYGNIVSKYKKINLSLSEREDFSCGGLDNLRIIKTPLGRTGQSICWDLANPIIYRSYAKKGADVIVNQSFWYRDRTNALITQRGRVIFKWMIYPDYRLVDSLIQARANENNCIMIFCNAAEDSYYYKNEKLQRARPIGLSQVTFPIFGKIASGKRNKEEIIICGVPRYEDILADYETMYGLREDIMKFSR